MNTRKIFVSVFVLAVIMLATMGISNTMAVEELCHFEAELLEPDDCACSGEATPIVVELTYYGDFCVGNCSVESAIATIDTVVTNLDVSECGLASCTEGENGEQVCNLTGTFDSTVLCGCGEYDVDVKVCYMDCEDETGVCTDLDVGSISIDNVGPTFELEMPSEICVCEGDIVDLYVDVDDDCCSELNESTVKGEVEQGGEVVKVNMTCDEENGYYECWSEEGELNTTGMGGDYTITFTAEDGCGNVGSATLVNLTVDNVAPVINSAVANPDTISLIGMLDEWAYCDVWDVLDCECEACYQTHTFGPYETTLLVNATDECKGVVTVERNCTAIIEQLFADVIADFTDEEREDFWEEHAENVEERNLNEFYNCDDEDGENCYGREMDVYGVVHGFFEACDDADIDVSPMVVLEKINLGEISIPITVEDECGNNVTGSLKLTIVDYQMPLKEGWNVRSVPITLEVRKMGDIAALGDGLSYETVDRWNATLQVFEKVLQDDPIRPLEGYYVYMTERDQMGIVLERDISAPPTKALERGFNLIGAAILPFETMRADLCLKSIELTPSGLPGYTNVISLQQAFDYEEVFCNDDDTDCCNECDIDNKDYDKWFVQKPWVFTVGQEWEHSSDGHGWEYCWGECYGDCSETCSMTCEGAGIEECEASCGMECIGNGTEICEGDCSISCEGYCEGTGKETCNASCAMECEGKGGELCETTCNSECYGNGTATCDASCKAGCKLECGFSAYSEVVDLVEKDPSDWSVVPGGDNGTLSYTMGADEVMNYEFVMNSMLTPNTDYCLVFYTRKDGTISWLNSANQVWDNQNSGLIDSGKTDGSGVLSTLKGTFDFTAFGTGLDYINDGDDYDGSVYGGKVWLVPCSDYNAGTNAVTDWHPGNFLFEEDLVTPTPSYCECYGKCNGSCTMDCYAESFETCHGTCITTCEAWGFEECHGDCTATCEAESYEECYIGCEGNCTEKCVSESEATCLGGCTATCVVESYEYCYGGCYGGCYEECWFDCDSWWKETYGETQYPELGQDHFLCKYWMDNGGAYWVYMENPDTLAGFTTTPVYMIDLGY